MFPYLHTLRTNLDARAVGKRRPLEVWVLAGLSSGVEFCCADAV